MVTTHFQPKLITIIMKNIIGCFYGFVVCEPNMSVAEQFVIEFFSFHFSTFILINIYKYALVFLSVDTIESIH